MKLYNELRSVEDTAKRPASNGRYKFTDINPQWRLKRLTETFGPCGFGFTIRQTRAWSETCEGNTNVFVEIELKVKNPDTGEWSEPIFGTGGNSMSRMGDEAYKCAYTDAISVACKALGLAADVYYEADTTKYDHMASGAWTFPSETPAEGASATPAGSVVPGMVEAAAPKMTAVLTGEVNLDELIGNPEGMIVSPENKTLWRQSVAQVMSMTEGPADIKARLTRSCRITERNWNLLLKAAGRATA